jgi:hypothetical protein
MSRQSKAWPGDSIPGQADEHTSQASLEDDATNTPTATGRIGDIRIGLCANGGQRRQALAMLEAALTDDVVRQVEEMTELGFRLEDAVVDTAAWWSMTVLEAIREGARLARERAV